MWLTGHVTLVQARERNSSVAIFQWGLFHYMNWMEQDGEILNMITFSKFLYLDLFSNGPLSDNVLWTGAVKQNFLSWWLQNGVPAKTRTLIFLHCFCSTTLTLSSAQSSKSKSAPMISAIHVLVYFLGQTRWLRSFDTKAAVVVNGGYLWNKIPPLNLFCPLKHINII